MTMTTIKAKELGALVAEARARKGLSTRQLAPLLGVSNGWITRLEAGDYLDPSPALLAKVAEHLDIPPRRIDQLMPGAVAASLPSIRTYFRAKYDMTPAQVKQIQQYIDDNIEPPTRRAA